jgi:hypothetical protein
MGTKDLHKEFIKCPQHEMKNKTAQNTQMKIFSKSVMGVVSFTSL